MHSKLIFSILDSVDSTNNYAMGMVHAAMAKHGTTWFAKDQFAGKGQRSKHWISEPGSNITMSTVLNTKGFRIEKSYELNAAIAVACCSFLNEITNEGFKIKWPNDIMWRDRKAGGILIENVIRGNEWLWSVVGTGLNINQTVFEELSLATSLKLITGKEYDVIGLAKLLQQKIVDAVETSSDIMKMYNSMLYKKSEEVNFKKGAIVFKGIVDHADEFGMLHLKDRIEPLSFGEVQWMIGQ